MDTKTNLNELKEKIKKFCEERDWDQFHNAKELAIGIITESSELLEHFRFKSNEEVDEILKNKAKRQKMSCFSGRTAPSKKPLRISNCLSKATSQNISRSMMWTKK